MQYSEMDESMKFRFREMRRRVPDDLLFELSSIFALDDEGKGGLGVTLYIGGSAFSGVLANERVWAKAIADTPGGSEFISKALLELSEIRGPGIFEDPTKEEWEALSKRERADFELRKATGYIHLVDAQQFVGSDALPSLDGVPIRVRLSEVQGWSIGRIGRNSN